MKLRLPAVLPTLEGSRLTLRAMDHEDAQDLLKIYGDPLVMRYTGETPFADLDTVGLMLDSVCRLFASGESLEWVIVMRESGELVGTCGLHSFAHAQRSAEVGCLLKRSAWRRGHMTEAIGLITRFAADALKLSVLMADVEPDNEPAQRLFKKLGYRRSHTGLLQLVLPSAFQFYMSRLGNGAHLVARRRRTRRQFGHD